MHLPIRVAHLFVTAFQIWNRHILLILDPIEILVQHVKKVGQKFGRILLNLPLVH